MFILIIQIIMSFIKINYKNISDLIHQFRTINFNYHIKNETCNFVALNKNLYYGCYGGIFSQEMLKVFENRNISFIYDIITPNLCLIWWNGHYDNKGDMSLCKDDLALVTVNMYQNIKMKKKFKKSKTSYF